VNRLHFGAMIWKRMLKTPNYLQLLFCSPCSWSGLVKKGKLIKIAILMVALPLFACQNNPTFCQTSPSSSYCDEKTYTPNTLRALRKFEEYEKFKSFAFGKTTEQYEYFGFSYSYKSLEDAQNRALQECRKRIDESGKIGRCVLIR
jgi:hypothetical protein